MAVFGVAGSDNNPAVRSFTVAPGGLVTLTFIVNVNTATLITCQKGARATFTDYTRATGGPAEGLATVDPVATPGDTFTNGASIGGSSYASGSSTVEDVQLRGATVLSVSKTNRTSTLVAGSSTAYTVTFINIGGFTTDSAVVKDGPGPGTSSACTIVLKPLAASVVSDLFDVTTVTLPAFPATVRSIY